MIDEKSKGKHGKYIKKKNDLRANLDVCLKQLPEVPPSHDPSNFTLRGPVSLGIPSYIEEAIL